ncbi:hypothetical protein ACJJTC_007416 [Scirpophaga incertulas]
MTNIKFTTRYHFAGINCRRGNMTQIRISDGVLEGELVDNEFGGKFYSFKGIPYAVPPIGNLRFKAPRPAKSWAGVRSAKQCGPMCYQRDIFLNLPPMGSEDCLYLNVYSPDISPKSPLPVMVWIHGGGFICGSSDDLVYGPDFLVRHNVVVVTINYRVGTLGFLCLDTEDVPGNAGMKDQVLALKWVKKNVEHFGGDANNITIFGESAGGASVGYHLVSPMSKGLFKRAICQSGCSLNFWTTVIDPRQKALVLAKQLGFYSEDNKELYEFFKNLPVEKLIDLSVNTTLNRKLYELDFAVVFEKQCGDNERFVYGDIIDLLSNVHEGVDIMSGYTEDEGILAFALPGINADVVFKYANEICDFFVPKQIALERPLREQFDVAKKFKKHYLNGLKASDNLNGLIKFLNMDFFAFELITFSKFCAGSQKNKVYLYKFTCKSELNQTVQLLKLNDVFKEFGRITVSHADDLHYLFPFKALQHKIDQNSESFTMINNVTTLWTNFAKFGNPTPDSKLGVQWAPFSLKEQHYLDISNKLVSGVAPDKDDVELWEDVFRITVPRRIL